MKKFTIAIIDDHKIVRQGLKELLQKILDCEVTHEFENGINFLDALPLEPPPDLYVLDYSMPGMNGIRVLIELKKKPEEYKVLLLTQQFDEKIIDDAYLHGARGFLNKNCTAADLQFAVENIINFGYTNITDILKRIKNYEELTGDVKHNHVILTEKERDFLELVCDERELTYDQMAEMMKLSVKTLEGYRGDLFDRFKLKSKVGLVLFSYKHRLTRPFL